MLYVALVYDQFECSDLSIYFYIIFYIFHNLFQIEWLYLKLNLNYQEVLQRIRITMEVQFKNIKNQNKI